MRKQCLLILLALLAAASSGFAGLPAITSASIRYRSERWETENGLPQNMVVGAAQTTDGMVWTATVGGVAKFDGQNFQPLKIAGEKKLTLRCLHVGRDGTLRAGTQQDGLFVAKGDVLEPWAGNAAMASKDVRCLLETRDGALWIGTGNQLIRLFNGRTELIYPQPGTGKMRGAYAMVADGESGVLVGSSRGLLRVTGTAVEKVVLDSVLDSASIVSLARSADGTLWVGSAGRGIMRVTPDGRRTLLDTASGLPSNHVRALLVDHVGRLWAGTLSGLVVWSGDRFVPPEVPDTDLAYDILSLHQDVEGCLWVGGIRGLVRLDAGRFALLNDTIGVSHRALLCVKEFSDGSIWLGSSNGGVTRVKDGQSTTYRLSEGPERTTDTILSIEELEPGVAVVGTYAGMFLVRNGRAEEAPAPLRYSDEIRVVFKDAQGVFWFGTASGLWKREGEQVRRFRISDGLPAEQVRCLEDDGRGGLWIGTGNGLASLREGRVQASYGIKDGLPSASIYALYLDAAGVLWVGTDHGLACFRGGRFTAWTEAEGLFSHDIRQILEDNAGNLWLSGPRGIHRMRKHDLEQSVAGERPLLGYMRFGSSWGVPSCENFTPSGPTACRLSDGRLVFATVAGLLVAEPAAVEPNRRPPPVVINQVRYRNTPVPAAGGAVTVGPVRGSLEIDFAGLSYRDPDRVVFRYRMDGVDTDWVETSARRTVTYHNLNNGTFLFRVIACNNDGVWNEAGVALRVVVVPYFYETVWFRVLALSLVVVAAYAGYRWRLGRIRSRSAELERVVGERTRSLREEILQREQAEKELRLSEERFSRIFSSIPIPLALIGLPDGRITDANPCFCGFVGQGAGELLGRSDQEFPFWPSEAVRSEIYAKVLEKQQVLNRECAVRIADRDRKILLSAEFLGLRSGAHMLLMALDITDRDALEQQVRQLQKIEATGQLAAGIAHDFNNLLTVVIGHLCLMRESDEKLSADGIASLEQGLKAAERAAALTRQLLMFSRKQRIDPRPFQPNEMIQRLAGILRPVMGEPVVVRTELAAGLPLVNGDEALLEQVIVNIAMNARDAMPGGGTLRIRTAVRIVSAAEAGRNSEARAGRFVQIEAVDTGTGMPPEVIARIFEPFFTTKEPGRGTGLGMPMAYGTVKQHGGWLEIRSEPGRGSAVSILLPAWEGAPGENQAGPEPAPRKKGNSCILYVEDEMAVRTMIAQVLERNGYQVLVAANARDALRIWRLEADRIDFVFSDIVMPGGMNGIEFVNLLRRERPELRVMLTTGYSAEAIQLQPTPDLPILGKPYTIAELLQAIERCLGRKTDGAGG